MVAIKILPNLKVQNYIKKQIHIMKYKKLGLGHNIYNIKHIKYIKHESNKTHIKNVIIIVCVFS